MKQCLLLILLICIPPAIWGVQQDLDTNAKLIQAVRTNNIDYVRELLLLEDVNINQGYPGKNALIIAIEMKHSEIVKLLLENGADVLPQNYVTKENTPHEIALSAKDEEIITIIEQAILDKVSRIDKIVDGYHQGGRAIDIYDTDQRHWGKIYFSYDRSNDSYDYIDETYFPFSNKAKEKSVFSYLKGAAPLEGGLVSALIVGLTGISGGVAGVGFATTLPGIILNSLAAYYYPHDFFNNNYKYWGTIGTALLAVGSFIFLCGLAGVIFFASGLSETGPIHYGTILQQLNKGIRAGKKRRVSIKFDICFSVL